MTDSLAELLAAYDYFIFDLYGTLIDIRTDEWAYATWVKFCEYLDARRIKHPKVAQFRADFFELDKEYRNRNTRYKYPEIDILDVYAELFLYYGNEVPEDISDIAYYFRQSSREYMRLFPGLRKWLGILKQNGKKIFILSNAQASYTMPEIEYFGFDKIMDDFIISSDYGCMKPEKHLFDILIERNHMDRSRTVMFGDSLENDCNGALAAGISAVHVTEGDYLVKGMK